jgi:hypothetical protein
LEPNLGRGYDGEESATRGGAVEHAEWMNAEVRQKIEDLRRTYGFEEREAIAYWHLSEAHQLMIALANAAKEKSDVIRAREYEAEGLDDIDVVGRQIADSLHFGGLVDTYISQHFESLLGVLGKRVLRRDYPEGWGGALAAGQGEDV